MAVLKPSKSRATKKKIEKIRRNKQNIDRNKSKKNNTSLPERVNNDSQIPKRKQRMRQADFEICTNSDVYTRAKELQASSPSDFPSAIRIMLPSHVSGGFWLHLPKAFSDAHLPKEDVIMTLEGEDGKKYNAKYLWKKTGLSGGWRGFSIAHNLLVGDAVIFQLVRRTKFKVYILRANGSERLLGVATSDKNTFGKELKGCEVAKDGHNKCATETRLVIPKLETSDEVVGETFGHTTVPESVIASKEVGSMENFEIVINKLVGDSEISKPVRAKYYELCCSQQSFLHECLLQGLNSKLVAGIIYETVILADAIRACEITTSIGIFFIWGQTLKAFEDLGMNVGFLLARLDQLVYLAMKLKMCRESRSIETLDVKPVEPKEVDIELESAFQEVKNVPW